MAAGIVLACIIHFSAFNAEPVFVCIEATPEKANTMEIYKDLQAQLSLQAIQDVSSFDTTDDSITLVIFVYDEMILEGCGEELLVMVQNKGYSRIDYYIVY